MMEEYTFASAAETAWPLGLKALALPIDEEGIVPEAMDELLSNWDVKARGARKPYVLYTIPTGQNPTGATQSAERRRAVYKVSQKHDVLIIEDEPYYFLQMQPYSGEGAAAPPPPATHDDFIKSLVPSFLSMDVDGRVVRLESFSKVVSPGSRVGWIVASEQIIERFVRNFEVSSQNPSGISQLVLYKLLDEHWGHSGYLDWLIALRMSYTDRRDALLHACEKHLPRDIAHWVAPAAGMFVSSASPVYPRKTLLTFNSTGSRSTGVSTPALPLARPARLSKKRSSCPLLTTPSSCRAEAGSRPIAQLPWRRCSSARPMPLHPPTRSTKLFLASPLPCVSNSVCRLWSIKNATVQRPPQAIRFCVL